MQIQWKYSPTQLIRSKRDRERLYICSLSRPKISLRTLLSVVYFRGWQIVQLWTVRNGEGQLIITVCSDNVWSLSNTRIKGSELSPLERKIS